MASNDIVIKNRHQEDELSRQEFIDKVIELVDYYAESGESYSLGINGTWGCGKSFVLDLLEKDLSDKYLIFHYNCWENDYYEEPLVAIISVLLEKLEKLNEKQLSIVGQLKNLKDVVLDTVEAGSETVLEYAISNNHPEMIGTAQFVSTLIKELKVIPKRIQEYTHYDKSFDTKKSFAESIKLVQKKLEILQENKPLVFIVDELDRCIPEYAIKVLERLHHISHNNKLILLISYDKEKLSGGIAKIFGKNYYKEPDRELLFATEYLQKFINEELFLDHGKTDICSFKDYFIFENTDGSKYLDASFMEKFYNSLLKVFHKRELEFIFNKTYRLHSKSIQKEDRFEYGLICAELILVIIWNYFGIKNALPSIKTKRTPEGSKVFLDFSFIKNTGSLRDDSKLEKFINTMNSCFELYAHETDGNDGSNFLLTSIKAPNEAVAFFFNKPYQKLTVDSVNSIDSLMNQELDFFEKFKINLLGK